MSMTILHPTYYLDGVGDRGDIFIALANELQIGKVKKAKKLFDDIQDQYFPYADETKVMALSFQRYLIQNYRQSIEQETVHRFFDLIITTLE